MIKISHTHEGGKVCYDLKSNHSLIECQLLRINGNEFAAAYMPYCAHYFVYDPKTGREVASMTKEFYESIKHFKTGDLTLAPTCK